MNLKVSIPNATGQFLLHVAGTEYKEGKAVSIPNATGQFLLLLKGFF